MRGIAAPKECHSSIYDQILEQVQTLCFEFLHKKGYPMPKEERERIIKRLLADNRITGERMILK